jgi:hypothetical protein
MREPSMRLTDAPRLTGMSRPLILTGAAAIAGVGATVCLWAHYGATVFFETIRSGFAACFG